MLIPTLVVLVCLNIGADGQNVFRFTSEGELKYDAPAVPPPPTPSSGNSSKMMGMVAGMNGIFPALTVSLTCYMFFWSSKKNKIKNRNGRKRMFQIKETGEVIDPLLYM